MAGDGRPFSLFFPPLTNADFTGEDGSGGLEGAPASLLEVGVRRGAGEGLTVEACDAGELGTGPVFF